MRRIRLGLILMLIVVMIYLVACGPGTFSEIKRHEDEREHIIYVSSIYGYRLSIPQSWEGKYRIEEVPEALSLIYQPGSDVEAGICSILVYEKDKWDEVKDGPGAFQEIAERDGRVFVHLFPLDNPYEGKALKEYDQLVTDAKNVVQSFCFID